MIRSFIQRVFGRNKGHGPHIIKLARHGLRREQISPCALKVTETLQAEGYAAFVVGGAVRDLLLGKTPKDFDVATDAEPEDARRIFRRSRIIGRRFRLVHVMCGQDQVEVSTFRGNPDDDSGDRRSDETTGRILRDNVFGSQEEDARRRDFTINALFYDPARQEIWDYHNGYQDLRKRVLRMIGDPAKRYREDPVRMLRAARFAAKLDFHIDASTRAPIAQMAPLLEGVPAARLFDEMLKLLLSGHALRAVHQLRAEGLHHGLLPLLDVILGQPQGERFVALALKNTDERIRDGKPVSPGFLFAALLWQEVRTAALEWENRGEKTIPALHLAIHQVLDAQSDTLAIPRRYDAVMKEIWLMQPRFLQRSGQRPFRLLETERFRAAFDFLLLRCGSGEVEAEVGQWWEKFQHTDDDERQRMLVQDTGDAARRKRRKRTRKPREASTES